MKQSLIKLVDAILEKLEQSPNVAITEGRLRSWLLREGYNKRDIDAAIRLVGRRLDTVSYDERPLPIFRTLSVQEEHKLSREARAALARLEYYSLIDMYEREMILDRVGQFEGEVGLDELDYLLNWVVYSMRDVETQQTIYNVVEGSNNVLN